MQTRYTNETHSNILLKAKLPGATVMQENQVPRALCRHGK